MVLLLHNFLTFEKHSLNALIASSTELLKSLRGKKDIDYEDTFKSTSVQFENWYINMAKYITKEQLYKDEKLNLKFFMDPHDDYSLDCYSDIKGFIDVMEWCLFYLEGAIKVLDHRDSIGASRYLTVDKRLSMPDYEEIINHIYRYGVQMTLSSSVYNSLDEESIRQTIVNALNTTYKGLGATGEMFNKEGRADIGIKSSDGKNLFVAECKIIHSKYDSIKKGINQLFERYISSMDDKAALLYFNKQFDPSEAKDAVEEVVDEFLNNKKLKISKIPLEVQDYEYTLRYNFEHPEDRNKVIKLTVMVINIRV